MDLIFHKMQALGNDFFVFDLFSKNQLPTTEQFKKMGDRHFGVGCDQFLCLAPPTIENTDFSYFIFNADGYEVDQCGNGSRCVARYAFDVLNIKKNELYFSTRDQKIQTAYMNAPLTPEIKIGPITDAQIPGFRDFLIDDQTGVFVDIGNPHCVFEVESFDDKIIQSRSIALQSVFSESNGINVGYYQKCSDTNLRLRVYERGVGETLACGSGACAAVIAAKMRHALADEVTVMLPGGHLQIAWKGLDHPLFLKGDAAFVFSGKISCA